MQSRWWITRQVHRLPHIRRIRYRLFWSMQIRPTHSRERMPGRYYPDVNRTDGNGAAGRDDRKVTSGQKIKNRTRKAVPGRGCFSCVRIQKTGDRFSGTSALVADKEDYMKLDNCKSSAFVLSTVIITLVLKYVKGETCIFLRQNMN